MLLIVAALAACSTSETTKPSETATFNLEPAPFDALAGWDAAPMATSLNAFRRSCEKLLERSPDAAMVSGRPAFGTVQDWKPACYRARSLGDTTDAAARRFFRRFFRPFRVAMGTDREGLFTGYFEPQLQGSRERTGRYDEPLHRRPPELVEVPLGRFFSDRSNDKIFGHVQDGQVVPYHSRAEIAAGKLNGRDLALVWVDSRVDKFFLQIQGSGRVVLRDSSLMRVGYAAENGHPYRAIGRDLIAMNAIPREEMSMQAIRRWLADHPRRADAVMNKNPSYVFFRTLDRLAPHLGPLGAQEVPLTPEVSLAVDPRYVPYGAPLYLSTRRPSVPADTTAAAERQGPGDAKNRPPAAPNADSDAPPDTATVPFQRLMIAQDTGGAINGAVRGDVFWGAGDRARSIAGRMKARGSYTVLLPRTL